MQGTVLGTYLHGPVLAANPDLTDALLACALEPVTGGEPLARLDDDLERRAHAVAARRPREELRPARTRKLVAAAAASLLVIAIAGTAAADEIDDDHERPPAHVGTVVPSHRASGVTFGRDGGVRVALPAPATD